MPRSPWTSPPPAPAGTPARTKVLIVALTVLIAGIALCVDRNRSGDLYLQLFTGRFISEHGFVTHDPFPTIGQGRPWLNQQWLSELGFYTAARSIGITGLTVLYAALIAAPLGLVLFCIRRKGAAMMIATAVVYVPGLLAIVHPRAAGFTLLAFCLLVALVLTVWRPHPALAGRRLRWALIGIPLLFGIWANLHGGFIAGLLLITLATVGLAADRLRGLPDAISRHRIALLALAGLLATVTATLATPLGGEIWSYVFSFRNPAISLATTEWEPATQSTPAIAYLAVVSIFAGWVWWRSPRPRRLMPPLVVGGFVLFAAVSMRNLIFVAPALAFLIACSAPDRSAPHPRSLVGLAGGAARGGAPHLRRSPGSRAKRRAGLRGGEVRAATSPEGGSHRRLCRRQLLRPVAIAPDAGGDRRLARALPSRRSCAGTTASCEAGTGTRPARSTA